MVGFRIIRGVKVFLVMSRPVLLCRRMNNAVESMVAARDSLTHVVYEVIDVALSVLLWMFFCQACCKKALVTRRFNTLDIFLCLIPQ